MSFRAEYILDKDIDRCLDCGAVCAGAICQRCESQQQSWYDAMEEQDKDTKWAEAHPYLNAIRTFFFTVKEHMIAIVCKIRDHDVECVNSWATPDSGGETFQCKRCGAHWRTVYY